MEPTSKLELVECAFRCRVCREEITASEGEGVVSCSCGAIAVDVLEKRQGLMRRRGHADDFVSLCVWRNVASGEIVRDAAK
jgi:hypothetical protein